MKFTAIIVIVACIVFANAAHVKQGQKLRRSTNPANKNTETKPIGSLSDVDYLKTAIESGLATFNRAVNVLEPLFRDSLKLGKDVTLRLARGAPTDHHARAADNNLFARFDDIRTKFGKALDSIFGATSDTKSQRKIPPKEQRIPYSAPIFDP